jgi:hypothetical protein
MFDCCQGISSASKYHLLATDACALEMLISVDERERISAIAMRGVLRERSRGLQAAWILVITLLAFSPARTARADTIADTVQNYKGAF